jgi:DNA-binding winged helix-turn-helix (wHTH) protein
LEEEEYEYDILWDSTKQLWVTTVKKGGYLINAKIKGFKEINEYVEIGDREFRFECIPVNQ